MKEAYKDKCFGESMIFKLHGNLNKGSLSVELVLKLGRSEIVVNDRNVNNA